MVHGRVAVVAQRDIAKLQLRRHLHFIASQTSTQSTALTAIAAANRDGTAMRKIDQVTACAG
jgi:hypothetical protein